MEYEFNLKFKLGPDELDEDDVLIRLGEAGCTDALVGVGLAGYVELEFIRDAQSAADAILSALHDVRKALPNATLVEAGPDFVGLTDVADLVGVTRQNMRKLFVSHSSTFPSPVHGGSSTVWHLAHVLLFLKERKYDFAEAVLDVALTSMQVNIAKETRYLDSKFDKKIKQQLTA